MIGRSTFEAMLRTMASVNMLGVVEVPMRTVGLTSATVVARSMMPPLADSMESNLAMVGQRVSAAALGELGVRL